ncbi:MAG TPA: hypothetical protein VNH18_00505 [Bryobacteraceae bacterium]|nr:hypothetical protein [Bryobacteraceae bacterium]
MPFCTQCGTKTGEADVFCSGCGARQPGAAGSARPSSAPPPFSPAQDPLANLSPRTAAILCYIPTVGWIAAVVVLAARKFRGDQTVRFHAFQGLYLFAAWLMVQWVIRPMSMALYSSGMRIDRILEGLLLAVSIFMIIKASRDEAYVLPIIGELAQRSAVEP